MTEARGGRGGGNPKRVPDQVAIGARLIAAVTLALLPFGCGGGQTGQPTAAMGGCDTPTVEVPVDRPLRTVVPIDAARALEGTQRLPLVWIDMFGNALASVPEDEVTLTFTYDGGGARYNPCNHDGPDIEMTLDVSTRDSGLVDSGTAWVSFFAPRTGPEPYGPSGEFASFSFSGAVVSVSGRVLPADGGTVRSGTLKTTALPAPLGSARFPPP
jgi:hypothetical protein